MVGMASCGIHVVNSSVLSKIESFLNDPSYKEAIENSASYNTRLCFERRLRMPFLDSQTGVAQNHSNLFMTPRQRIPGLLEGQIYTYPAKRWRKKRRQYLMHYMQQQPKRKEADPEADVHTITTVENPAATNEDSKDSAGLKDESAKDAWYYDEIDMQEIEGFEEPDPESDLDYEEPYSKRRSKKRGSKVVKTADTPSSKKPKGPGRGRKKINYDASVDAEKPFSCELCGVRYKTRPGLTYHYTHSHKDVDDDDCSSSGTGGPEGGSTNTAERSTSQQQPPATQQQAPAPPAPPQQTQSSTEAAPAAGWSKFQDSYLTFLKTPGQLFRGLLLTSSAIVVHQLRMRTTVHETIFLHNKSSSTRRTKASGSQSTSSSITSVPTSSATETEDENMASNANPSGTEKLASEVSPTMPGEDKDRAVPSPYCDFCLGDANQNKKTGESEELVSCSDCGRSGHPTCLQFTPNMIVSVRKYRWQCIECKCCSICGNSDNDDQLLFCDDCDRGYHMYCLAPPLLTPPEGSWSCSLCLIEFHKK